jgi:hypothetical protein
MSTRRERRARRAIWRSDLRQDLVYAARGLRRQPAFTATVLLVLSLGIGANTVVFSVLQGVMLRPLAVQAPERLFVVTWGIRVPGAPIGLDAGMSERVVEAWRARTDLFEQLAWHTDPAAPILSGLGDARHLTAWPVSPGFFDTLGVRPLMGRVFTSDERWPASAVTIVSYAF